MKTKPKKRFNQNETTILEREVMKEQSETEVENVKTIVRQKRHEIVKLGRDEKGHFIANNSIWKLRTELGRQKLFTPDENGEIELITKIHEYFNLPRRKWIKKDFIKSGATAGKQVKMKVDAPLTIEGFCTYLGIDVKTFRNYKNDPQFAAFFPIFTYVDTVIKKEQYEGAILGLYDSRFIALYNGIKEQHDITTNDQNIFGAIQFNMINNNTEKTVNEIQQALNSADD